MDSVGSKPDLMATGTRYDHYVELREVFALGGEVIDGLEKTNRICEADKVLRTKLQGAVEVINKRLSYLSNYEMLTVYSSPLATTTRVVELQRKAGNLPETKSGKFGATHEQAAAQDVHQVRPEESQGGETLNA